jgi:hypothetical protein
MSYERLILRGHALERMFERGINLGDIRNILRSGEIIQRYPEDTPYPSYLMLGHVEGRPLHLVAADNDQDKETIVITVYEPDPNLWDSEFKRRKA